MNKKGNILIIVGIIIILLLIWLITIASYDCNSDNDCGGGYYCDVKHTCNKVPVIEKNNLEKPATIIAISIVLAALILKWRNSRRPQNNVAQKSIYRLTSSKECMGYLQKRGWNTVTWMFVALIVILAAIVAFYPSPMLTGYAVKKDYFYISYPTGSWCQDSDGRNPTVSGLVKAQYFSEKANSVIVETVVDGCATGREKTNRTDVSACLGITCFVQEFFCKPLKDVRGYDAPYGFEFTPCMRCSKGSCLIKQLPPKKRYDGNGGLVVKPLTRRSELQER